jgi:hypothetical protein
MRRLTEKNVTKLKINNNEKGNMNMTNNKANQKENQGEEVIENREKHHGE